VHKQTNELVDQVDDVISTGSTCCARKTNLAIRPRRRKPKVGRILGECCILMGSIEEFAVEQAYGGKANTNISHDIASLKIQDNIIGVSSATGLISR
jgi:hypothetical protein